MAGDEEDGGGELRKLNKENEHEKKEVGGLNVSIEQNEYSKVALKNMLEIRKARISEISSQDCRELTGRSRFQILQKLKALHLENKQKPPLEPNGEVPEMKRKQNERITDNITLIQKEPVSKSLKPGNREKILDILRKSKQAQALQQEQKQEQKQEQEQEPQQQEQHQQQQHQQKQQQQQQQQQHQQQQQQQHQPSNDDLISSKKSSSFASDGKDENLSVSQTSELLENARTNILRRISFTANKKTNTAGSAEKSQPHSTPGEPRADQTYPSYQGSSFLSLFGVPELDAEVEMGMEQEQEALQEYQLVHSTLHRLMSDQLSVKTKLRSLKKLRMDQLRRDTILQVLQDTDLLYRGVETVLENYLQKKDEDGKNLLILTLQLSNKCLLLSHSMMTESVVTQPRRTIRGYQLHQHCILLSQPGVETCNDTFSVLAAEFLGSNDSSLLGRCFYTLEKESNIIDDFLKCLNINQQSLDAFFLRDLPTGYRLVRLFKLQGGEEMNISDTLIDKDKQGHLWSIRHPEKELQDSQTWTEVKVVKFFPSGHFLAYVGVAWREKLDRLEKMILQSFPELGATFSRFPLKPGNMILVKFHQIQLITDSLIEFKAARAVILSEPDIRKVLVYLPDYGVQGWVSVQDVHLAPEILEQKEPVLTFCRLQDVGPSPGVGLIRETILACSLLTTPENVSSLISRPYLNTVSVLSSLLLTLDSTVVDAVLSILRLMVESSYSLSLLNKPSRNSRLPPSLGNLAPSLLNLLEKEQIKSEPELFLKSNEILFALLSSAEPGQFRDFMRAEGKRLMDLNHPDLPEKSKLVLDQIFSLPMEGKGRGTGRRGRLEDPDNRRDLGFKKTGGVKESSRTKIRRASSSRSNPPSRHEKGNTQFTITSKLRKKRVQVVIEEREEDYTPVPLPVLNRHVSSKLGLFNRPVQSSGNRIVDSDNRPVRSFVLKSAKDSDLVWMRAEELLNDQEIHQILDLGPGMNYHQVLQRSRREATEESIKSERTISSSSVTSRNCQDELKFKKETSVSSGMIKQQIKPDQELRGKNSPDTRSVPVNQETDTRSVPLNQESVTDNHRKEPKKEDTATEISQDSRTESTRAEILTEVNEIIGAKQDVPIPGTNFCKDDDARTVDKDGSDAGEKSDEIAEKGKWNGVGSVARSGTGSDANDRTGPGVGNEEGSLDVTGAKDTGRAREGIVYNDASGARELIGARDSAETREGAGGKDGAVAEVCQGLGTNYIKSNKPQGGLEQGTVLVKRPGAEIEMLERIGTSERDAGRLAVIISAMANTTGGTIFIG